MRKDPPMADDAIRPLRQKSFDDYFRVQRDRVYQAIALTIGDRDLAAEATDEAMVRTYERWRRVRAYDNPPGWTYRVALNFARSRMRRRKYHSPVAPPEQPHFDAESLDPALVAALARLPMEYRAVIVLRYFLDWSQEEIGAALEIPVGTVKSRTTRGLDRLRAGRGVQ
jgi:RNA polymerase sigma-70 factor (ECF subfamily)